MKFWFACTLIAAFVTPASAADILSALYDARTDEIVVDIAYRGTRADHDFTVQWDSCRDGGVAGRLVDEQGNDAARTRFRVTRRLSLDDLPCRPAVVTLRLGRVSHMSVRVPARARSSDRNRRCGTPNASLYPAAGDPQPTDRRFS
jgi:hypothetical protein